jgi:hypothetical protein
MKTISRLALAIAIIFAFSPFMSAQEMKPGMKREEMHVRYVVAKAKLERNYMNNAPVLDRIVEWAEEIQKDTMVNILSVEFCGAVSPEGSVPFNHWLSVARLNTLEKYVRKRVDIPEELIVRSDHYIAWDELKAMVLESDLSNKDEVMEVLNSENTSTGNNLDSRIAALKALDGGKTWRIIFNRYFIHMRNAYMVIVTDKSEKFYEQRRRNMVAAMPSLSTVAQSQSEPVSLLPVVAAASSALINTRYMYVKTNLVGLGLLMGNLGVEFDLGRYLSLNIPVYYSALDYFKPTVKFRTFATQPELRVWPMTNEDGLFIGAHAGFAYYNFAFGGDWRYQDHDGTSPTLGGGLSLGYRLPISKNKNWKLELSVGAGVYPLYYDVFHNLSNIKEGQLYDTRSKTYIGLDNINIGISYRIPMKKAVL